MFRLILASICLVTFAACVGPFAKAQQESVGTDFEFKDLPGTVEEQGSADTSIQWDN